MEREKIEYAKELAKKSVEAFVAIGVTDKIVLRQLKEAESKDIAEKMAAMAVSEAWLQVRKEQIKKAEAEQAEAKLILSEALQEMGLTLADLGLENEQQWDYLLKKED